MTTTFTVAPHLPDTSGGLVDDVLHGKKMEETWALDRRYQRLLHLRRLLAARPRPAEHHGDSPEERAELDEIMGSMQLAQTQVIDQLTQDDDD